MRSTIWMLTVLDLKIFREELSNKIRSNVKLLIKAIIPSNLLPLAYLTHRTIKKARGEVQSGPFSGMKYIEKAYCSSICPKLTGTYEKEIQNTIKTAFEAKV